MALVGFVDWRGNAIRKEVHGGVRAAWFLYVLTVVTNVVIIPNLLNLVTYLHGTMHMGVSASATTTTNFFGATSGFAMIAAFLSDSYITRFRTMLLFGPFMFLGYGLLALQAYLPSLRPPACNIEAELNSCEVVHGWNATLLYTALYMTAFGDGFIRVCLPSLGADQFDHEDPSESRQQSSFFNWYTFGISFGGFVGLILIVWLENYKGWDIGLGVLVVAFRNRKLELPEKLEEATESCTGTRACSVDALAPTNSLKFLDKACINRGQSGAWSVSSLRKVEETKVILHVLPLFVSSMIGYISNVILFTFTVQQGTMTNTRLGKIHVSPATLFIIPIIFQMLMLAVYDQFLVPFLRRRTGYVGGVTHLQRIGIGFVTMLLASVIAAIVERKRKEAVVQMSLFWLAPQFFLLGVADVTSFTGLLEFFNSEAPRGMKSIATALFWCALGLASLLATTLVEIVNKATRHRRQGGWLEGTSLNNSRLDLFYWVVAVVGLLGFCNYLYWAKKYVYQHNPHIVETSVDQDSP
uniref:Peptide transporter PTR1 n=1 Tax=Aegilops tauschii TaxID=37682 RepID=M8C3C2_AEGTA